MHIKPTLILYLLIGLVHSSAAFSESEENESSYDDTDNYDIVFPIPFPQPDDSLATDELKSKTSHSFYYEQFKGNNFAGYVQTIFANIHDNSDTWVYAFIDYRLGYVEAYIPQKPDVVLGTINLGLGIDYGIKKDLPLNLFSAFGFDLIEFTAKCILTSSDAESGCSSNDVNVDMYFTLGIDYKINKTYTVSLYGKRNDISGNYIRDHLNYYYGAKLTIF